MSLPPLISSGEEKENDLIEKNSVNIWDIRLAKTNELRDSEDEKGERKGDHKATPSVENSEDVNPRQSLLPPMSNDEEEANDGDLIERNSVKGLDIPLAKASELSDTERERKEVDVLAGDSEGDDIDDKENADFIEMTKVKRDKLKEDLRQFRIFKRDVDKLENWIYKKLHAVSDESFKESKIIAFQEKVDSPSNWSLIVSLHNTGQKLVSEEHFASETILKRFEELNRLFALLKSKIREKLVLMKFLKSCDKVFLWINDKKTFATADEHGTSLEHVEVLKREFNEFMEELEIQKSQIMKVNTKADKLIADKHPEKERIQRKLQELKNSWNEFKQVVKTRESKLLISHDIHRFHRDADKALAWISETDHSLSLENYNDQIISRKLIHNYENFERDGAAFQNEVITLGEEADRLCGLQSDQAEQIRSKHKRVVENWEKLVEKTKRLKSNLDDSYFGLRFSYKKADLENWLSETKQSILADELPKDLDAAVVLLERHLGRRGHYKNKAEKINTWVQSHIDKNPLAAKEIAEKELPGLNKEIDEFRTLWKGRKVLYDQCMEMQWLHANIEKANDWMTSQQTFLKNTDLGDSFDSVEALIKKHEEFEKSLTEQESKNSEIVNRAKKIINWKHDFVVILLQDIALSLERYAAVRGNVYMRKTTLRASLKRMQLKKFEGDFDETSALIRSKMGFVNDSFDLEGLQIYEDFMKELHSHKSKLDKVVESGRKLAYSSHNESDSILARANQIASWWEELEKSASKMEFSLHLKVKFWFNHNVENVELWMSKFEARLNTESSGNDLTSAQILQMKHEYQLLEGDLTMNQVRVVAIRNVAEEIIKTSYFDKNEVYKQAVVVWKQFTALKNTFITWKKELENRILYDQCSTVNENVGKLKSRKRANDLSDHLMDPQDLPTRVKVMRDILEEKEQQSEECWD